MGTAFIRGLQGEGSAYRKLDATPKHYLAHSGPEALRHGFNAVVNPKDLRETYAWAFAYCIRHADPSAVMGSYNRINGEPACASPTFLKEWLFGEMEFEGYVVSDCGAIADINRHHGLTANEAESAALAVNNGCHLNCGSAYQYLLTAMASGLVSEEAITDAVERLFAARFRLGMFDEGCPYHRIPYDVVDCAEHRALNRRMAREGIVLLKNDGVLPLKEDVCRVAVIGPNADDVGVLLGNYNGTPRPSYHLPGGDTGSCGRQRRSCSVCPRMPPVRRSSAILGRETGSGSRAGRQAERCGDLLQRLERLHGGGGGRRVQRVRLRRQDHAGITGGPAAPAGADHAGGEACRVGEHVRQRR